MNDQYPIMSRLKESRIVSFKPQKDGTIRVQEKCDRYFTEYLTRGEILALAAELAAIDLETLYNYNPAFNRWATDPDGPHSLLLPIDSAEKFEKN